jgi:hypothetical protein
MDIADLYAGFGRYLKGHPLIRRKKVLELLART